MINWDDIRVFLALSSAGTQKAAAKLLKVDQATVGRRIKEFESALGTKLFDKRSDGFLPTAAGLELLDRAKKAEALILEMERGATALDQRPQGVIRLAMPGAMANHWLVPRLKDFLNQYPEIQFEFLTGPEVVNLWKREADIAIRLVRPSHKDLVFKKIGEVRLACYATKALAAKTRKTRPPASLPFVGLFESSQSEAERSVLARLSPARTVCRSHAWSNVYHSIKAGLGFGILPSFFAEHDRDLTEIPDSPSAKTDVWLVVHPDVRGTGRFKVFVDFISAIAR